MELPPYPVEPEFLDAKWNEEEAAMEDVVEPERCLPEAIQEYIRAGYCMELPPCPVDPEFLDENREWTKEEKAAMEFVRMHIQARAAIRLGRKTALRSLGRSPPQEMKRPVPEIKQLQMEEEAANVITLTGLEIFPKVGGGETIVGTLDVHANGFLFHASSSPDFHFDFLYSDVKKAFFRVEDDENRPPILHLHLHDPVKLGSEKRQDIQFRLVQQKTTGRRGEDLKKFVCDVEEKWKYVPVFRRYPFGGAEVGKTDEFQGNLPSKGAAATVFGLTFSELVGVLEEPFVVVDLYEIEIVNLRLKPAVIDMTIVFLDHKRDLLQINSIPIEPALDLIKDRCNFAGVKYYVNSVDMDWVSAMKLRADDPQKFWRMEGWLSYGLETPETQRLYKYYMLEEIEEFCGSDDEGERLDDSDDKGEPEALDYEGDGLYSEIDTESLDCEGDRLDSEVEPEVLDYEGEVSDYEGEPGALILMD